MRCSGPWIGRPPTSGQIAAAGARRARERPRRIAGHREDRPDRHQRVRRRDRRSRRLRRSGVEHARRRARARGARDLDPAHAPAPAMAHEIVLERQAAALGVDEGADAARRVIGRSARADAGGARRALAVTRESGQPVAQPLGAPEVRREVAVAELEPRRRAEARRARRRHAKVSPRERPSRDRGSARPASV